MATVIEVVFVPRNADGSTLTKFVAPNEHDVRDRMKGWWPVETVRTVFRRCSWPFTWTPWVCGAPLPCRTHDNLTCFCGRRATAECPFAGQFVCGYPVCHKHPTCNRHGG